MAPSYWLTTSLCGIFINDRIVCSGGFTTLAGNVTEGDHYHRISLLQLNVATWRAVGGAFSEGAGWGEVAGLDRLHWTS